MSLTLLQPKANAIFFIALIADFAKARPTCLAAHTKMILYFFVINPPTDTSGFGMLNCSDSPIGVSVLPVPVGAIYNISLGLGFLQTVNICF